LPAGQWFHNPKRYGLPWSVDWDKIGRPGAIFCTRTGDTEGEGTGRRRWLGRLTRAVASGEGLSWRRREVFSATSRKSCVGGGSVAPGTGGGLRGCRCRRSRTRDRGSWRGCLGCSVERCELDSMLGVGFYRPQQWAPRVTSGLPFGLVSVRRREREVAGSGLELRVTHKDCRHAKIGPCAVIRRGVWEGSAATILVLRPG
jgi:hypothetical protein